MTTCFRQLAALGTWIALAGLCGQSGKASCKPTVLAQEPVPLDPPRLPYGVFTARVAEAATLPQDLEALTIHLDAPDRFFDDIPALESLRALHIDGPTDQTAWSAERTAVLAGLTRLEVLTLPIHPTMGPEHLRALAKAPTLRYLTLALGRELLPADVRALAKIPNLVSLSLRNGRVGPAAIRELSTLPRLLSLTLTNLVDCDEATLSQLRLLHQLRQLRLARMGRAPTAVRLGASVAAGPGLTIGSARALRSLPLLESLQLNTCQVSAEAIDALPRTLTRFSLTDSPDAGDDVIAAIARLPNLRCVHLDACNAVPSSRRNGVAPSSAPQPPSAVWEQQARLLRKPTLREFHFHGPLPDVIRSHLARATNLTFIGLMRATPEDVEAAASCPQLERLQLEDCEVDFDALHAARKIDKAVPLRLIWLLAGKPAETVDF